MAENKNDFLQYILIDENNVAVDFYTMLEISVNNSSSIPTEPIEHSSKQVKNRPKPPAQIIRR